MVTMAYANCARDCPFLSLYEPKALFFIFPRFTKSARCMGVIRIIRASLFRLRSLLIMIRYDPKKVSLPELSLYSFIFPTGLPRHQSFVLRNTEYTSPRVRSN